MPCPSGSWRRNISPFACSSGVIAISTAKGCTPFLLAISSGCSSAAASRPANGSNAINRTNTDRERTVRRMDRASIIATPLYQVSTCVGPARRRRRAPIPPRRRRYEAPIGWNSVRGGSDRNALGAHLGGHHALRARPEADHHELAGAQLGDAEAAQRLHVHED